MSATNNTNNNSYCQCGTKKLTCRTNKLCLFVFLFSFFCEISYWKNSCVIKYLCLRTKVNLGIPWISSFYIFQIQRPINIQKLISTRYSVIFFDAHLFFDHLTIGLLRYFSVSLKNSWKFLNLSIYHPSTVLKKTC